MSTRSRSAPAHREVAPNQLRTDEHVRKKCLAVGHAQSTLLEKPSERDEVRRIGGAHTNEAAPRSGDGLSSTIRGERSHGAHSLASVTTYASQDAIFTVFTQRSS